jgi:hypothetical protein
LLPRVTEVYWWLMSETRIILAPVLAAIGRDAEATRRLDEALDLLAKHPDARKLQTWHAEAVQSVRPAARRPHFSEALSDAELRILHLFANNLSLREISRERYL